jgi:hypothetical protein
LAAGGAGAAADDAGGLGKWPEITCVEGAKDYDGRNFAKKALMPAADKPDF